MSIKFSKNNFLFFALFAGGIVLPTAILSFLSFRNIQNEIFLAQKTFDENRASFQKEVEDAVHKEQEKIYQETKAASLFLYEQPRSLLEFGNAASFKEVPGIEAIFLYNGGKMRMIINNLLSPQDKQTIIAGQSNTISDIFDLTDISSIQNNLSNEGHHFFECLAWLISNKRLEIKILLPRQLK